MSSNSARIGAGCWPITCCGCWTSGDPFARRNGNRRGGGRTGEKQDEVEAVGQSVPDGGVGRVAVYEAEAVAPTQFGNVGAAAGDEIVQAHDLAAVVERPIAE
ncbi:hypothetical protein [Streptomyces alfalfae]|uniref:hypothetical protein n=1 Tax=Streptomyces alfalfae TaxID=1642299 RepID=UPI0028126510|nr:hypothetical protein [Streptomyces alfalfae]